jgi:hypothetical protein
MSSESVKPNESNSTSSICVSKEEAKNLSVGESTSLTVSGKVKSISEDYAHNDKYIVTIESPSNSYDEESNSKENEMTPEEMSAPDVEEKTKNMSAAQMRKRLPKADKEY